VTSFKLQGVVPWGRGRKADKERRGEIQSAVDPTAKWADFDWFFFLIECDYNPSRWHVTERAWESWSSGRTQGPDVDNIVKPITDALVGIAYADDSVYFVRGATAVVNLVSGEAQDLTRVEVFGHPRSGRAEVA
jgi:hypothetical protein